MPVRDIAPPKEAAWRVKQANVMRPKYVAGTLVESETDPLVWRLLKFWSDEASDPLMKSVTVLYSQHTYISQDIISDFVSGISLDAAVAKYNIDGDVLDLFRQLYADIQTVGGETYKLQAYSKNLTPHARNRHLAKHKHGELFNIFQDGVKAIPPGFSTKDVMDLIRLGMYQSAMLMAKSGDYDLSAQEHKTILAYTNAFMMLTRLLQDMEANSTNVNVVLDRLASYTKKISTTAAVIPALATLTHPDNQENFKLVPAEDITQ